MAPKLTKRDVSELSQNILTENLIRDVANPNSRIWVTLRFACQYDKGKNLLELYPYEYHKDGIVRDIYRIEINFSEIDGFGFPKVRETSDKIISQLEGEELKKGKLNDLHLNEDRSCCLGIFPHYRWVSACDFIIQKIIPYLYWQSHKRIKGEEAWSGYSHKEGPNEYKEEQKNRKEYLTSLLVSEKKLNGNEKCPCGSGKKYKKCCRQKDDNVKLEIERADFGINYIGRLSKGDKKKK